MNMFSMPLGHLDPEERKLYRALREQKMAKRKRRMDLENTLHNRATRTSLPIPISVEEEFDIEIVIYIVVNRS